MTKKELSAKDKAFEKERVGFRKEIRERDREIKNLQIQLYQTKEEMEKEIRKRDLLLEEKEAEIASLTKLLELKPEDVKLMLERERVSQEAMKRVSMLMPGFSQIYTGTR